MELDLLDGGGGGTCGLGGELGSSVADALVGGVDVVEKDFLGLVARGSDPAGDVSGGVGAIWYKGKGWSSM